MKLQITQYKRTITIEDPDGDDMSLSELHENVLRPALLAMEYHPDTIDKLQFIEDTTDLTKDDHYVEDMVAEEGYIPCIPWEQIESKMGKKGFKEFNKWMGGQTVPQGGVYEWDLNRYLKGLPNID